MGDLVRHDISETYNNIPLRGFCCLQLIDATMYTVFTQRILQGVVSVGRGKVGEKKLKLSPDRMKKLVEYLENREIPVSSYNFTLKPPPADPVDFCGTGACSAASSTCSITPEGNVVPCTYFWGLNGENLRDHTFQWILENSPLLNYFRSISLNEIKGVCRECKWLSLCHGGCKAENYIW